MSLRFRSWPLSGISLVHVCQFHRLARDLLHSLGQLAHILSLLLVGWCHMQGEQVSQGIHRRVYLRTLLALRPVITAPRAALRRIAGCGSPVWLLSDRVLCPPKAARVHANRGPSPRRRQPLATSSSAGRRLPTAASRVAYSARQSRYA